MTYGRGWKTENVNGDYIGYVDIFYLLDPPSGEHTVEYSASHDGDFTFTEMIGNSVSYQRSEISHYSGREANDGTANTPSVKVPYGGLLGALFMSSGELSDIDGDEQFNLEADTYHLAYTHLPNEGEAETMSATADTDDSYWRAIRFLIGDSDESHGSDGDADSDGENHEGETVNSVQS